MRTWLARPCAGRWPASGTARAAGIALAATFLFALPPPVAANDDLRVAAAVERQEWDAAQALIAAGADVTAARPDGATALHWAAHWGHARTVASLIAAGAAIDALNDLGVSPIWITVDNGNADVALQLLDAGADAAGRLPSGETLLMTAARRGLAQVVSRLIEAGADVRLAEHERGQTALMWAASEGHADIVRRLAESGAAIDARSVGRFTALMFAARAGDVDTARVLLNAGADIEARSLDGSTPLIIASRSIDALAAVDWAVVPYESSHEATAHYLIERGADVNAADRRGRTPLFGAVERNRLDLARTLLDAGAEVDATMVDPPNALRGDYVSLAGFRGATPLWAAARECRIEMMRLLIGAGADPLHANAFGVTVLMIAAGLGGNDARRAPDHRVVDAVTMLLDLGADVHATSRGGQTALHGAASMWEDEVIQLLVDRGADVNVEDSRGRTPLHLVQYGNANAPSESTAALLRQLGATEPVVER